MNDTAPEAPEPSLRESLEAAAAELDAAPTEAAPETQAPEAPNAPSEEVAEPAAPTEEGRQRDEKGRFAPKDAKPEAKPEAKADAKPDQARPLAQEAARPQQSATPKPEAGPTSATEFKAPQSWKPQAREKWGSLPPEVQAEVARVDKEVARTLQETAEARQNWQRFQQTVGPFEAMVRAEGGDVFTATQNLFATAAALRTAPVAHKGQVIASLINTFGVPLDAINAALPGGQGAQSQAGQPGAMPEYRDPRVDELMAQLHQAAQQRQQQLQQKSQSEIESFGASHEFFDDVREEMADLLEVATRRGAQLSLEDAYKRAIQLKPDIAEVLRQREAAKQAQNTQSAAQRAKHAASSIRSQPTGAVRNGAPLSLREELEQAALQVDGR